MITNHGLKKRKEYNLKGARSSTVLDISGRLTRFELLEQLLIRQH